MWHFHQVNPKDYLFAKQLLFSLEQSGKLVYPNWRTCWSFDDKLGQKYQLEALKLPLIPSFSFYSKTDALNWAKEYMFPAVFKLRGGAGSSNVKLIRSKQEAIRNINKAFGKGFRQYNPLVGLKEAFRKFMKNDGDFKEIIKEIAHIVYPYWIEQSKGREKGYVYFQQFIPDCSFDIRVQFVGNKSYAMKRYVRKNDFRASGGGNIDYDGSKIPVEAIKLSFEIARTLDMQTLAVDLIPVGLSYELAEISYAFAIDEGECEFGFWDNNLKWHPGKIDPCGWMVEDMIRSYSERH
jgi:glutathione synthase/RimK-type ligase-like ATP-grasp enzyme